MKFTDIKQEQDKYLALRGKYFQVKAGERASLDRSIKLNSMTTNQEIHEYVCPDGSVGFTLYEYRMNGAIKEQKATGFGCGSATYDWERYYENDEDK
jgi:hypothetical protein